MVVRNEKRCLHAGCEKEKEKGVRVQMEKGRVLRRERWRNTNDKRARELRRNICKMDREKDLRRKGDVCWERDMCTGKERKQDVLWTKRDSFKFLLHFFFHITVQKFGHNNCPKNS